MECCGNAPEQLGTRKASAPMAPSLLLMVGIDEVACRRRRGQLSAWRASMRGGSEKFDGREKIAPIREVDER